MIQYIKKLIKFITEKLIRFKKKIYMNKDSFKKYELDKDREEELWRDSIIIFDTSALIDFYYYPKETRQDIFDKIFESLKGRLWVPFHVQFEYLKNRKSIIEKPIKEKYDPLKEEKIQELKSAGKKIKKISEQIKNDTKKPESHPYLAQDKIDNFIEFTKEINKRIIDFEGELTEEIQKQEAEIKALNTDDTILKAFEESIQVGEELPFAKIMEIVKEGKLRYEFKIPPGYMDLNEKIGSQIFGDLIVWKQILSYSKAENKSVIFVCNDLKIDWCYKDTRNRIERPREELVKEFNDNTNQEFWMYNQSQFLYKAKELLKVELEDSKIEEISRVIDSRNRNVLIFRCGYCRQENSVPGKNLFFDFEAISGSERSMGEETQYQAIQSIGCFNCGNEMDVTSEIWEYPVGTHNYDRISIDKGQILQSPDFVSKFWDEYHSSQESDYFDEPDLDELRNR